MFSCRKINLSAFSGKRQLLLSEMTFPEQLKSGSDGTLVATIENIFLTNLVINGYVCFLLFHHFRGLLSKSATCSALYNDISRLTLSTSASLGGIISVSKISPSNLANLLLSSSSSLSLASWLGFQLGYFALHFFHLKLLLDSLHCHKISAC